MRRNPLPNHRRRLAAVVASALLAAGCGGRDAVAVAHLSYRDRPKTTTPRNAGFINRLGEGVTISIDR